MESLPFVRMRRDDAVVVGGAEQWRALACPGEACAVWLPGDGHAELMLAVPPGEWRFERVDVLTGAVTAETSRHDSWARKVRGVRRGRPARLPRGRPRPHPRPRDSTGSRAGGRTLKRSGRRLPGRMPGVRCGRGG